MNAVKDADFFSTAEKNNTEEKFNVGTWLNRISKGRQKEQRWRQRTKNIVKLYRDDGEDTDYYTSSRAGNDNDNTFNILFANTSTLAPALYSAVPKPDVRNRFLTQDRVTQTAGQVIERVLGYSLDIYGFSALMKDCVQDYLLSGRGVLRVRLISEFKEQEVEVEEEIDGVIAITQETESVLSRQEVRCELVPYDSFVIEPAKRWEDVTWIAFIHMLSQKDFEEFFPNAPLIGAAKETDQYGVDPQYQVYEVWDKTTKKVYYIGQAEKPFKIMDDPLKLTNFWPIPQPLYSIKTNNTLVPVPEYTIYQAQAYELNKICYRITKLVDSCKFIGIYDSQVTALNDFLRSRDSQFTPVPSNLMRDGGIKAILDILDISPMVQALAQLYVERDQIKSIIHEITGISDILRGESNASETATAQNIKSKYAGLRLRNRRDDINTFVVELLRMKAELICTFFTKEQLEEMSGIEITPEIEMVLKSDILRSYKVDIETDSTILADMDEEAQKRSAIVASITQFIGTVTPLVQQGIVPLETAKALLMFPLQATKISRELQDALELIGSPPPQNENMQMPMNPQEGGGMPLNPQEGIPQDFANDQISSQEPLFA